MDFVQTILEHVTTGGPAAISAVLFAAIAVLIWDRKALAKELADTHQKVYDAKDQETNSIKEIVDKYHKGNLDLVQALNEIKIVLVTIQSSNK